MKKQLFRLSILVVLFIGFSSCSGSDDGGDTGNIADLLVDKWWYIESDTTADLFFNSNGDYQEFIPIEGGWERFGTWEWVDESELIIKITYDTGQNYMIKFIIIEEESIILKFSFNDGETYGSEHSYQDTEI